MTKKDAEAAEKKEAKQEKGIDELILDYGVGKYSAIPLAAIWVKELKRREENRHLTANELLEHALSDVLSGKVGWKEVKKALAASSAAADTAEAEAKGK